MKKKHPLHQSTHPFDAYPFESFRNGSWQAVESLRIKNGAVTMHFVDNEVIIEEKVHIANLRIRSRKANDLDCSCLLRPGVDICVLSTCQNAEDDPCEEDDPCKEDDPCEEKKLQPVWIDAKIKSIERKRHQLTCECQFYISFYVAQGSHKKVLSKEINMVHIDQISVLQKLGRNPCEDNHCRWNFSEDSTSLQIPKLITGKFSSDLSWLLVASVLKQLVFDARSIQNKIVYQIQNGDYNKLLPDPDKHSLAVNFKIESGVMTPFLVSFASFVEAKVGEDEPGYNMNEGHILSAYDLMDLRRSKRRYVQPERYLGCDKIVESDIGGSIVGLLKTTKSEYEDMPLALSIQDDHAFYSGKQEDYEKRVQLLISESNKDYSPSRKKAKSREPRLVVANQEENHCEVDIAPVPTETDLVAHEVDPPEAEISGNTSGAGDEIAPKYISINGSPEKKKTSDVNFLEVEGGLEGRGSIPKSRRRKGFSLSLERESPYDVATYRKRPFSNSARVCREWIKSCMKNIESTINKEQPLIIDQWKEFRAESFKNQRNSSESSDDTPSENIEEENSELDMLWKEMELSLLSACLLEDDENDFQDSNVEISDNIMGNSRKRSGNGCQHEYQLDEEIGILCHLCGFVSTEIKDVCPSFMQGSNWTVKKKWLREDYRDEMNEDANLDLYGIPASSKTQLSEGKDNVWTLIPELKEKLRFHQKKAFEFLWRNIAGSLEPALMESASKNRGGCVISHTPGAGKTLLIISFLVSYLKLFPGSRPLVLAPKTTLYTWYKEIIKWKIPIPVYQIHGGKTYRGEVLRQNLNISSGVSRDAMHVLDCLEKIQKWLAHPSVLLMGYTSFLTLTREESRFAHRKYMGQVLRECPGILILDEGHNPRSTKSRLRKALMKVDSGLRILLSGTLFQNNFCEYFNTLCLARPTFVSEVLRELDPKFKRMKPGAKTRFSLENRARKFFTNKISSAIDSSIPRERIQGLNILRKLTNGFIDVYEGGISDNLPGLQLYTLLMKPTTIQGRILVKLQNQRPIYKGFPLELELLITLASIHPWLIRTTACSSQYFSKEELDELDQYKFDLRIGSKIRFIMSLIPRCLIRKEKVLIFCHNIAPINLFIEIFETYYGWKKGEDVLVLQGDIELFERGRIMDQFEEPGGSSKVLLASITACAEGISLTAASRVILLDSEWNPSKSKQAIARAFRPGQAKVVYVYQLLATGTLEEEKYRRTTWKEWVSNMIFSEEFVEDPSHWQAEKIEDDILREIVEEDRATLFHMIMKNEKASNGGLVREVKSS